MLLGVPIAGAENPVIAGNIGKIAVAIRARRCGDPAISPPIPVLSEAILRIMEGTDMRACIEIQHEGTAKEVLIAPLFIASIYTLYKLHDDAPRAEDIVELWSATREIDVSWRIVEEAIIYASATGRLAAYRGLGEAYPLSQAIVPANTGEIVAPQVSLRREDLGEETFSSLVHLMGIAVLKAAERLRDAEDTSPLERYATIHGAVAYAAWGLIPSKRCIWSPSVDMKFVKTCFGSSPLRDESPASGPL